MKIFINIVLMLLATQFMVGCSKKEPAQNSPTETAAATENTTETTPQSVKAAVVQPQQPVQKPEIPAVKAQPDTLPVAAALKGLKWVKGTPVAFEPDKVYVVEFWATWCGPCKVSIPHLTEIQKQYKDKGVTVIGVSTEEPETVKPFVDDMGDKMDYTVAVDVEGNVQKNYMEAFGANGIPHAFIVNGSGKIVWNGHPMDDMDTILDLVVAGNFDPAAYAEQKAKAAALEKQVMAWYMDYFKKIKADGLTDETKQIASNFIDNAPPEGLNAFAWNILTQIQESDRDVDTALKAAQKANELTEKKDPSVLDTYALALFTSGKIDEAIETQQKAVDLASDYPQAQEELRQRLEQYKAALGEQI